MSKSKAKDSANKGTAKSSKASKMEIEKELDTKVLDFCYNEHGRQKIIQITKHDVGYLEVEDYLNDSIINFFLK